VKNKQKIYDKVNKVQISKGKKSNGEFDPGSE
jgi:hypothetical protein